VTGALYGVDHGVDWLGDDAQQEELNLIEQGHRYGWPYLFAKGQLNQQHEPPGGLTAQQWATMSDEPVAVYTPHAAPMQLLFYTGSQFPAAYRHDAFVTMHGSWNRRPPSGYEVVRVRFEHDKPVAIEPFLRGFLADRGDGHFTAFGRPVGLALAKDGALLVSDDANGVIYRVSYHGPNDSAGPPRDTRARPAGSGSPTPTEVAPMPLAIDRPETAASAAASLTLRSPAFAEGQPIPPRYADYGDKISPELTLASVPAGAKSIALIMEDPDAKTPKPFVHWLLYNLPPGTTTLHESMPSSPRLADLGGALQGLSSHGNVGYFGPRPPKGDPPHHYHFEVFALDRMLELQPGIEREALLKAMKGHVLARGRLQATFEAPKDAGGTH
jgi:Raf kinase inhibitor-like YbhB/YbcL family protein